MGTTCPGLNVSWLIATVGNAIDDFGFTKPW